MRPIWVLIFALPVAGAAVPPRITVDYPIDGSIFPPEITAPTFLWRDAEKTANVWRIAISFAGGGPAIHTASKGPRMRIGPIDPDCVAETNRPPKLTPRQAAAHTWIPSAATWEAIKKRSTQAATVTITGYRGTTAVSRGRVTFHTSKDPVGAPVFYRDVPLMPAQTEEGVIQPLAPYAVRMIRWRLRDISQPRSRVVMEGLPVCANCHSFSADGKTLGMDLDGLQGNRGLYSLTPVAAQTSMGSGNVFQWRTLQGELKRKYRVGFMSQVSPDGKYVVTTIDGSESGGGPPPPSNYYVVNFKDYRFLQVFYPTRGILAWYSRETGVLQPLPGANDPRFVQMSAVWSPDGKYLVFARAPAKDPHPEGAPPARFANDPNELPMQYDLYRVPFNEGKGGVPEPIAGASHNGMSNTFPKVSPDGRWIIFVQCRNGQLMRPDSQLYIVPAAGGTARRMRCNTTLMNSWHSFSPNGRWMVFSSKSRSPYTQMYLTHIDEQGNDSPAIYIDNSTASNRAVNLPEFVNIAPDGLKNIGGPALEFYRLFDRALYLQKQRRYEESAAVWQKTLDAKPDDAMTLTNLAITLALTRRRDEAVPYFQKAAEIKLRRALAGNPSQAQARNDLGVLLLQMGRTEEGLAELRKALRLAPEADQPAIRARISLYEAKTSFGQRNEEPAGRVP